MQKIWLKNYPPGVPETINPDEFVSLVALFEKYTHEYKDLVAFSNMGVRITYQRLEELTRDFAAFLQHQWNFNKEDRVAIMMPNLLQYPVVVFGCLRAGLTLVNVNPLYTPRELKYQLIDSGAKGIIVLENFAHHLEEIIKDTQIEKVIITKVGDLLGTIKGGVINAVVKYIKNMIPSWNLPEFTYFKNALKLGKNLKFTAIQINSDECAFLQYTGGTTGVPKGAVLTHRNLIANVLQTVTWVKSDIQPGRERVVGALPLYHIFALTVCCFCFIVLGEECMLITNPRDMNLFIKILEKNPPTIFIGLNTLFNALMNHRHFKKNILSRLRLTISGGMPMQKTVADRWQEVSGNPVIEGYGLTEASPVISVNPLTLKQFNGSIGLPLPSTDIAICDDEGQELGINAIGELCVRGPQIMKEYWRKPEETALVFDDHGWLRTGDLARIDAEGFLYIVDRKKDMIIVSGFNVYPNEVEEVIAGMEGVKEVAIIGIPSEKTGEAIKAFIVKKTPDLTEADVINYCQKYLTHYKIPKFIEFRNELPKTNVGKVLRRKLKEEMTKPESSVTVGG